ncbi:MAG: hypothetical protein NWQ09_05525 [Nonlabens sp.]|nr:hypothetical protein [Nonlabens sp.]
MKKILFIALAILASNSMIAQDDDMTDSQKRMEKFATVKKHEVSLDVTAALGIPAFSPRYEYILGRYSGVGADLFIAFENDDIDFSDYEKFSLTPYYRQYFFSKEDYGAKGFYAEGFVKFFTFESGQRDFDQFGNSIGVEESQFETAIGVGIGWKWVSDSGFLVDFGFGLGRNLGIADDQFENLAEVQLRGGLNFGWRF